MVNLYIISGMSGAGKSQALKIFEDFGFICVDNMPIKMVADFADICIKNQDKYEHVAISVDSRAGKSLESFIGLLIVLRNKEINYKILFFNASDAVLSRRYSETRRRHPLGKSVYIGIKLERKIMNKIFMIANEVIDTSNLTVGELKKLISRFTGTYQSGEKQYLNISVISFGYKYGLPNDADIVYDMRFIMNPNYVHNLKFKTGKDTDVVEYIEKQKEFISFFNLFSKLINTTLIGYINEGRSYLTIALGCTGGRHRSVFTAERLVKFLKSKKYKVKLNHRDILHDKINFLK
ncbi:MAG: RNase adapter RapZ [Endomicrobium sp.]|jgi:UPF0042 nucleotide-binding protein|nr:RNase adapter RapZ [Endomicrobium sp.]